MRATKDSEGLDNILSIPDDNDVIVNKMASGFDKIFSMHVPHILEKIFFSLDYEAYKSCLEVNDTWKELLTSERYILRGKYVFDEEILKDEEKLFDYCNADYSGRLLATTRLLGIRKLLASGMLDVNCRNTKSNNQTPLHDVALKGNRKVAQLLIQCGADVNTGCGSGRAPLHWAAEKGQIQVAQLLIRCGADPNLADNDIEGRTPLHVAGQYGHHEMFLILIQLGADPDKVDNQNRPAFVRKPRKRRKQ